VKLQGKGVLVTGGGSGIGLGVALALAKEGCRVLITGRDEAKLKKAASEHTGENSILTRSCNVASRDDVNATVAWAIQAVGQLDIVVHSAGVNVLKRKMCDLAPSDFDDVLATNCTGFFNILHATLPGMRERKDGLVISISSIAGKRALPLGGPAYVASKFAATGLATCVGLEERANGIRITSIYPGEVETPLLEKRAVPVPMEKRKQMVHPEDIGHCVVALAQLPANVIVPELIITPLYQEYM